LEEDQVLWFDNPFLQPFLESLTPGVGIQTEQHGLGLNNP
jgi:hypothetical protein